MTETTKTLGIVDPSIVACFFFFLLLLFLLLFFLLEEGESEVSDVVKVGLVSQDSSDAHKFVFPDTLR